MLNHHRRQPTQRARNASGLPSLSAWRLTSHYAFRHRAFTGAGSNRIVCRRHRNRGLQRSLTLRALSRHSDVGREPRRMLAASKTNFTIDFLK